MSVFYCSKTTEPPEPVVAYDRPDETLDIVDNVVEWDLWDSVDLKHNKLYKYSELVEHPMGLVYLDSVYTKYPASLTDRVIQIVRTRDYIYFENILEFDADPREQIYQEDNRQEGLLAYWIGQTDPMPFSEQWICVNIRYEYYFKLGFIESPYKFKIVSYN
jgi:hypothetical protein